MTQYQRGYQDRMAEKPRFYGCHIGMRSTLSQDRAEYYRGWDEAAQAVEALRSRAARQILKSGAPK